MVYIINRFTNNYNMKIMEEKRINEHESLEIITSMIARTKERYVLGDGNILLLWGYLVVAVSLLVWTLLSVYRHPAINWLWFLIWIIGGIATPIMAKKKAVNCGVKSYSDKISSCIWSVVGFSAIACTFCCLGFLLAKGVDSWAAMLAFALVIVPFGEIAQGVMIGERLLMWGGAAGLLAGIFTLCCIAGGVQLYASWFMPVFIAAFVSMMIIPGHIINHKAKHQE